MELDMIEVNEANINEYPPTCFLNPKNPGYRIKRTWLTERFAEDMKTRILHDQEDRKIYGFIHYIWINPNSHKNRRHGSVLITRCVEDAQDMRGVAVVTSDDSFMAGKDVFVKNVSVPQFRDCRTQLKDYRGGMSPIPTSIPGLPDSSTSWKQIPSMNLGSRYKW